MGSALKTYRPVTLQVIPFISCLNVHVFKKRKEIIMLFFCVGGLKTLHACGFKKSKSVLHTKIWCQCDNVGVFEVYTFYALRTYYHRKLLV